MIAQFWSVTEFDEFLPHQGFNSCLSERGLGKQLLGRGGIWRVLIDIGSSVFPYFIVTSVIRIDLREINSGAFRYLRGFIKPSF